MSEEDSKYLAEKLLKVNQVGVGDIKIGDTYKFSGRITKFIDDTLPLPRVQINYNIYATLQGIDKNAWEVIKGLLHQTAIFHCKVVAINRDGSLETECSAIGMGELQDDSDKS